MDDLHAPFARSDLDSCRPDEVALKSFFLGPKAENAEWIAELVVTIFERWADWRRSLFCEDGGAISLSDRKTPEFVARKENFKNVAFELLKRFEDEVPKFSPRYVGHMFSEISLPALLGHVIALLHNPNNISGESSQVGIKIENEAVGFLGRMVGYPPLSSIGHFTSGGTIANFEALTRAHARAALWLSQGTVASTYGLRPFDSFGAAHLGWDSYDHLQAKCKELGAGEEEYLAWNFSRTHPHVVYGRLEKKSESKFLGPVILVPENKHYSWKKGVRFLGLGDEALWPITLDSFGRLSIPSLKRLIIKARDEQRPILLIVSVVGTTELGGIDPVDQVQAVLDEYKKNEAIHIWHHVDAAYGGFFRTIEKSEAVSPAAQVALAAIPLSTSITLDPHKLGYVPYASGAFLARKKRDYYFSAFEDAPYVDFDQNVDSGPYTIEGSRSAAGASATWMTAQSMGLDRQGYGLLLERTISIRKTLEEGILESGLPVKCAPGADTNILCFSCALSGEALSVSNARTLGLYEKLSSKAKGAFIVSKTSLRWKSYGDYLTRWTAEWGALRDCDEIVLIRMCLMNPFFNSVETKVNYSKLFIETLEAHLLS